jgi:hypothetical protein
VQRARLINVQARGLEAGWVFPSRTGGLHPNSILDKPFRDLLGHLGITKRFTPHGLRRTCTDLTRQVSSSVVTKAITGHLTDAMHAHYSTVSLDEKRDAMRRVIRLVSGGSSGGSPEAVGEPAARRPRHPPDEVAEPGAAVTTVAIQGRRPRPSGGSGGGSGRSVGRK